MFRSAKSPSSDATSAGIGGPVQELTSLLDKIERTVNKSMKAYIDSIAPVDHLLVDDSNSSPSKTLGSVLGSLKILGRKSATDDVAAISSKNENDGSPGEKKEDDVVQTTQSVTESAATTPQKMDPSISLPLADDAFVTPKNDTTNSANGNTNSSNNSSNNRKKSSFSFSPKDPKAQFAPMPYADMAQLVETIRRIAELVVIGERAAATIQLETAKLDSKQWEENVTEEEKQNDEEYVQSINKIAEQEPYVSIFDLFFERNGLELITDVLTGKAFHLPTHIQRFIREIENAIAVIQNNVEGADEETKLERLDRCEAKLKGLDELKEMEQYHGIMLLPPLAVATQGFQSVSIMVQNVKRATSLFFILSNNHINQLINFPLDEYHLAERSKVEMMGGPGAGTTPSFISPRRFGSPELAELTTTFVTFLKSLALRMNAETLQFFLTYPAETTIEGDMDHSEQNQNDEEEHDGEEALRERPLDEVACNKTANPAGDISRPVIVKTIRVQFPLYERALEFCSAHQDSFVRLTAMNICLNTLRLTTVAPTQGMKEPEVDMESTADSPDATLHNAKALPMRERLAIAQYVCTPSRVEKLASPIFTKLAQLWGTLEEQFRDVETSSKEVQKASARAEADKDNPKLRASDKVARAREIARRQKYSTIFSDTSYNLQDELLLLEDVLRVGLTSFNEQTIEMMFATFVYPLLLQPLVLYFQRNPIDAKALFADTLNDHSCGREVKQSDTSAVEKAVVSAPARSALFCLAAAFQFLTNKPLLRLLFTAVFHPLAPDANGETMIRAKADVACLGPDGKAVIRIDPVDDNGKVICDTDRSTYVFGTVTGRKTKTASGDKSPDETCVFVLAPALMEILEFQGDDGGIVARSRHNPYRKAIFQCFTLSKEVSDLETLSVIAVDSAVSVFNEQFLAEILFGLDIKRYRDNLPKNERPNLFLAEPDLDDREIGGPASTVNESRLSLGAPEGGKIGFDYMNEVISSFQCSLINAGPAGKGVWRLDYDMVAAHALLACVRGNPEAIHRVEKAVKSRCGQAAAFLADTPYTIDKFAHHQLKSVWETISPSMEGKENKRDDELYFGAIMDMIVRGNNPSVLNNFLWLRQDLSKEDEEVPIYVSVSTAGNYTEVGERACTYAPLEAGGAETAVKNAVWSVGAWLKINALGSMLECLSSSKEHVLQDQNLGGFVFNKSSDPIFPYPSDGNTIYSFISSGSDNAMFGIDQSDLTIVHTSPGAVLNLVGKIAFPCVCEVPPSSAPLFSEAGAKVVSQGITWQSLYLVLIGSDLILAEPEKQSMGEGRVVTRCKLEDLIIEKDPDDARTDTTARRLILINYNTDLKPPGLFHFGKTPKPEELGPFYKVQRWKSALDIWFENSKALNLAYKKVEQKIAQAKAERGSFIRQYLANGGA